MALLKEPKKRSGFPGDFVDTMVSPKIRCETWPAKFWKRISFFLGWFNPNISIRIPKKTSVQETTKSAGKEQKSHLPPAENTSRVKPFRWKFTEIPPKKKTTTSSISSIILNLSLFIGGEGELLESMQQNGLPSDWPCGVVAPGEGWLWPQVAFQHLSKKDGLEGAMFHTPWVLKKTCFFSTS